MALNKAQLLIPPVNNTIGAVKAGSGVSIDSSGVISATSSGGVSRINAGTNITLSANTGSVNISLTIAPVGNNFPSGTIMPFSQSSAPVNWSKRTDFDNGMLRIVGGSSGGSTGGNQNFTTSFQSYSPTASSSNATYSINSNVGNKDITPNGNGDLGGGRASAAATTLTQNQSGNHNHTVQQACFNGAGTQRVNPNCGTLNIGTNKTSSSTGGGGAHQHAIAAVTQNFAGNTAGHNHPLQSSGNIGTISISMNSINLAVRYRDMILCTRN